MNMLPPEIPQCCHIKQNGVCCGSPALRGHDFCYYHQNRREQRRRQFAEKPYALGRAAFDLPTLEDINAIQVALEETIRAVLEDRIELKRAAQVLWGLQVASANARRVRLEPHWKDVVTECETEPEAEEEAEEAAAEGEEEAEEDVVEIKACAEDQDQRPRARALAPQPAGESPASTRANPTARSLPPRRTRDDKHEETRPRAAGLHNTRPGLYDQGFTLGSGYGSRRSL